MFKTFFTAPVFLEEILIREYPQGKEAMLKHFPMFKCRWVPKKILLREIPYWKNQRFS